MNRLAGVRLSLVLLATAALLLLRVDGATAAIEGITGTTFNLTASSGLISTGDGNSIFMWGYGVNGGTMQYPGPTLIVKQGDLITVNLTNHLPLDAGNVSIVFPGQTGVNATGGIPGFLTREATPGNTVQFQFTANEPGTYLYNSGTKPSLQVEMGLVGALIVRPTDGGGNVIPNQAYGHADTQFDHEYLFLLSEIDPDIHLLVNRKQIHAVDNEKFFAAYWLLNGRTAPDTMAPSFVDWLPTQPYSCMPMMHPGEKTLLRLIGAGRDPHPFHHHGNHSRVIARDGRLLESAPGSGADLSSLSFTIAVAPGQTVDSIYTWTGEKLGWDAYGHSDPTGTGLVGADCVAAGVPLQPNEYEPDHCKGVPVTLPDQKDLAFGFWYSGTPILGALGALPPGEGGFNPNGGFFFMWHSHAEKEITNNNIFPGGMLTMTVIEHPDVMLMNP